MNSGNCRWGDPASTSWIIDFVTLEMFLLAATKSWFPPKVSSDLCRTQITVKMKYLNSSRHQSGLIVTVTRWISALIFHRLFSHRPSSHVGAIKRWKALVGLTSMVNWASGVGQKKKWQQRFNALFMIVVPSTSINFQLSTELLFDIMMMFASAEAKKNPKRTSSHSLINRTHSSAQYQHTIGGTR